MQRRCLNWQLAAPLLAALLILAAGASTSRADSPLAKTDAPQPLPENIVTAWKAAGAKVGWWRLSPTGYHSFVPEKDGEPGDLPAFRFYSWQQGCLAKLPAPATAFGLDFSCTFGMTDRELKDLAGLKSLQSLNLLDTAVTDAGLKELAGLKKLQALSLLDTAVTDAGLKELAELKSLQSLNLGDTQVTDAGVEDLRKALPACAINR